MNIKPFLGDHFLLENKVGQQLYHDYAKGLPIIDYHCHLPPDEIAEDRMFSNLTKIWLDGDHYKWRALRTMGIDEAFITGDASDFEKFKKWAEVVPYTIRNPLFHWTHLELKNYFGINDLLNPKSAKQIYDQCEEYLSQSKYSAQGLIRKMNVEVIGTTDDPMDDLKHHLDLKQQRFKTKVLPTFRPDNAISIEKESFPSYIQKLGESVNSEISSYDDLINALQIRIDFFHNAGCRLSDHGLEKAYTLKDSKENPATVFQKRIKGERITEEEANTFKAAVLYELGKRYAQKSWVMQLHLGPIRNTNTRMQKQLGADAGVDSIGDFNQAQPLAHFLNHLDETNELPKTILYNINPRDNEVMATMIGNFNDGSIKGKMQYGSAWWFLDQKDGMEKQINALSNMGLLSCFIGMLTDSRSFLSYPRHEYFRRILCNLIGKDVVNGELPNDMTWLGGIVKDICYFNAKSYFDF